MADFAALFERHRGELRVHCYRMLGSFDEAEDLVQETFLRAWKNLDGFEGRSSARAWLYRIATNACLDFLDGRGRRALPYQVTDLTDVSWLQPFPDDLVPDEAVVARETLEITFLASIQLLPPRQRAVLLLRDVLGWPAQQTAELLDTTVASANSALQRARATLREHLPERRSEWSTGRSPSAAELAVLRRYMAVVEGADLTGVAALLAEDVRSSMPPYEFWMQGRDAVMAALTVSWDAASPEYVGRFRMLPVRANLQPAMAAYTDGRAFAISVLRIEDGRIAELTAFHDTALFAVFGLPMTFPAGDRLKGT